MTDDPLVCEALIEALQAPEPAVRRMAAGLLGRTTVEKAGAALVRAVDDDPEPAVRVEALDALGRLAGPPTAIAAALACLGDPDEPIRVAALHALARVSKDLDATLAIDPTVSDLADDPSPAIRAAMACLLASAGPDPRASQILEGLLDGPDEEEVVAGLDAIRRLGDPRPVDRIERLLSDPSPTVRAAAAGAVYGSRDADALAPALIGLLDDDAPLVRRAAADTLAACNSTPTGLVDSLSAGPERAQEAALVALRGHGPAVRDELTEWTSRRLVRASALRRARLDLSSRQEAEAGPATPQGFLISVLAERERRVIDLALEAMVVLGAPEAGGVIRRTLRSDDPETRAQALEALDSIGDRPLTRALVGLLETDSAGMRDGRTVLDRLADDDDPWIARLARVAGSGEAEMPDTSRTLGDLETMLFLRRVPLFEGLAPEDLQRIAMTAVERVYPPGEALFREGDLGQELVVVVEGSVRVVHIETDGTERLLRRYGAGDHIGELAVLREAARAATVVAERDGVRGLVIDGQGIKAILQERPDAAMAMLATLAERLSAH